LALASRLLGITPMRILVLLVSMAACSTTAGDRGGDNDVGSDCSASADCAAELGCLGPDDGRVCGVAPREECAADDACADGQRCSAIDDPCSRDTVGSQCRPACTESTACGAGFRCDNGACVAIACNAGYACPTHQVCDPARIAAATAAYDRHHGCFDVACNADAECAGLYCVNGICQTGAGTCQEPIAVP
jgi:hypothetical protein